MPLRRTDTLPAQPARPDGRPWRAADVGAVDTGTFADHHAQHENGGTDEISVAGLSGLLADAQTPLAHHATHEPGGSDAMAVNAAAGVGSLRTLGTTATSAAAGTDARLSDARTPTAHHASHENGGSDEVSVLGLSGLLADAQTPLAHAASHADAGTDALDVTTLDGYPGGTTDFLRADGSFAPPPGGGTGLTQAQVLARASLRG